LEKYDVRRILLAAVFRHSSSVTYIWWPQSP